MAAELPYFRFIVSEWMNGDISMETREVKGLFVDVCSWYWFKDCSATKAMLEKRFNSDLKELQSLYDSEIIKQDDNDIIIEFLIEQYDLLSDSRRARQEAGRKGGLSKAKAKPKQTSSYKIIEDKIREIIEYLNSRADRSYKWQTKSTQSKISGRLNEGFTVDDFKKVIDNKVDDWLGDVKFDQYLRPETLFGSKFESYLNKKKVEKRDTEDNVY